MKVHVNQYQDAHGQPKGRLLSLSEHLHILLDPPKYSRPRPTRPTGKTCGKCGQEIQTRGLNQGTQILLKCPCLCLLFSAGSHSAEEILKVWRSLHRVKARAELAAASPENN